MLELVLAITAVLLFLLLIFFYKKFRNAEEKLSLLQSQKVSQAVKYGKLTEQFIPFTERFPYSPEDFRFIGSPIDGIVFDEDAVVFCEFKAAGGQLNERQKRIRTLVQDKRIKWLEFRIR